MIDRMEETKKKGSVRGDVKRVERNKWKGGWRLGRKEGSVK